MKKIDIKQRIGVKSKPWVYADNSIQQSFLLGEEDTIYLDTVYFNPKDTTEAVIQKSLVPLCSSKLSVSVFVEAYVKRGQEAEFHAVCPACHAVCPGSQNKQKCHGQELLWLAVLINYHFYRNRSFITNIRLCNTSQICERDTSLC